MRVAQRREQRPRGGEALLLDLGRTREGLLGGEAGALDVLTEDVDQRDRVRRGGDVVPDSGRDRLDGLQDRGELGREVV